MKTVINNEVKLDIAKSKLQNKDLTNKQIAEKYGVSESTVRRSIKNFTEDAKKALQPKKKKTHTVVSGKRGYQGRTGRVQFVKEAVAKFETNKERVAYVQKKSDEQGLRKIKNGSVTAMIYLTVNKQK